MDQNEDVDIYGSLPDYDFGKKMQELEGTNQNLVKRVKELECSVESLSSDNQKFLKRNRSLDRNISVLYATALAEIEAKNRVIEDLKREKDSILFRRQNKDGNANQQNQEQPSQIKEFISSNVRPSRPVERSSKDPKNRDWSREAKRIGQPREDARQRDKSMEDTRKRDQPRESRRRDRSREDLRKDGSREDPRKDESRADVFTREDGRKDRLRKDSRGERPREDSRKEGSKEDPKRDWSSGSQRSSRIERQRESKAEDKRSSSRHSPVRKNDAKTKPDENKTVQEKSFSETTMPTVDVNFQNASVSVEKVSVNKVTATKLKEAFKPAQEIMTEQTIPAVVPSIDDDNQDTSTESNSSSTKENSKESKLVRAERLHQKKFAKKKVPEVSLKKEIKKISPLKKASSPRNLDQSSSTVDEEDGNYNDLLSSLLASEKNRINKSKKKKAKKSVAIEIFPKISPATPGKFLIEGNAPPPAFTPVVPMTNGAADELPTSSPEFLGVPETPGKSLLAILSADLEISPSKVVAEQQRKELESAVYSILPTPIKLLAHCPFLSPLHNTPVTTDRPRHAISNKTPEVETTSPEPTPPPPQAPVEPVPTPQQSVSVDSSIGDETMKNSSSQQTPATTKPSFPFKRRRVLKIKCTTSNNSSLGENSSMEEPPAKKACAPVPEPCLFSPPKQPEPRVPKPSVIDPKKTAGPKKVKSPLKKVADQHATSSKPKMSPMQKIITPNKKIQLTTPASVSSTGRKSNDSGASQDYRLHYTSDSEMSRSPSPYLPPAKIMTTSTPHPSTKRVKILTPKLAGLTPNSKKKQKRKIISDMFGASPASEREYHIDLDVTEELRRDLLPTSAKSKVTVKKSLPAEEVARNQRSKIEYEEKSRPTADRISKYKPVSRSPDYYRKRSPGERRRSPLEERRKSPVDRERRRSPPERRRSPEERERRRSPDDKYRRRSPEERERRRSPEEKRRYLDERSRRKSPVDRDRRMSPDDRDNKRRYVDDRRRSPDDRDRKYIRSSRSPDRHLYQSSSRSGHYSSRRRSPGSANTSSRRSPGPANTSSRRSPSPRDRRAYRDPSVSPARDEDKRRYKKHSRSISPPPKLNGSARHKDLSPRRQSGDRRGYEERADRSYQRSANSTLERRDDERRGGRESRGDSDEEDARGSRRQAPVRDLRNVIDKSRTKVQANKKRPAPIEEPPSEVSEEAGSEEGEVDSD